MKNVVFSWLLLFVGVNLYAQTEKRMTPDPLNSNLRRYEVDYELKDYTFVDGDSSILDQLTLSQYESLRMPSQDVEVTDTATGQIIILYSDQKTRIRKSKKIAISNQEEL